MAEARFWITMVIREVKRHLTDYVRMLVSFSLTLAVQSATAVSEDSFCIVPDEECQKLLSDQYESPSKDKFMWPKAEFLEHPEKSKIIWVQQTFYFLSLGIEESRYHFVWDHVLPSLKPTRTEMLEGVLPCLESQDDTIDEGIRRFAIPIISSATDLWIRVHPMRKAPHGDLSAVRAYFRQKGQEPPTKLVRLLYQRWPGDTLDLMLDLHMTDDASKDHIRQKRDLIGRDEVRVVFDPDKMKSDPAPGVADALNELIHSPHWWIRLYVVEVAHRGRNFDRTSIIETLRNDPEGIVRDAVQGLEKSIPR